MEPDRFDDAIRALFSAPSRRDFIRALVGLAVGALLAPVLDFGDAAERVVDLRPLDPIEREAQRRAREEARKRRRRAVSQAPQDPPPRPQS